MEEQKIKIPLMSDIFANGHTPEYLFWVGCAGAFDDRYKKVTRAFAKLLIFLETDFAILGAEESCSGDPARRAGNEMLYQMQAMMNIETFKKYNIKKILTICPHCFNIFKNEYPDLGGNYEVVNYLDFINHNIKEGKLIIKSDIFKNKKITYHDPCYLGRANKIYDIPREVIDAIPCERVEMHRNKSFALCCGAGGGQMFKEAEKGEKEVFIERTEEALKTHADIITTACPFCMVMITDGLKYKQKEDDIFNYDIVELIVNALGL